MTALRTVVSISALVATFTGASPGALAQTGKTQLAQVKPAAAASTWTCPFSVVELAPVSEETNGKAQAWVMVHRVNGEIVAAERVSQKDVAQIRALPCSFRTDAAPPLVG